MKSRLAIGKFAIFLSVLFIGCSSEKTKLASLDASVCSHANCADATIIQLTDQYYPPDHHMVRNDDRKYSAAWAEMLAFQYNIPLHVFERSVKDDAFEDFLETGRGGASVYFPSCLETFDVDRFESILDDIEDAYGKTISTLSYGCGKTDYKGLLPRTMLGGRNSNYSRNLLLQDAITWYGNGLGNTDTISFSNTNAMLDRPASGRFYMHIQTGNASLEQATKFVQTQVQKTVENKGFYTNFIHWDDWYKNRNDSLIKGLDVLQPLFKAMHDGMINFKRNSGLDYNEAIEYLYAREAIDSVQIHTFLDGSLEAHVWQTSKRDRDYSRIDTPVSVSIHKDSVFNSKGVILSDEVVSAFKNGHSLLLNLKVDFNKAYQVIPIETTQEETLYSLRSELQLELLNESEIRSSTNAKFVLFRRKSTAKNYEIEIVDRTQSFSEKYNLPNLERGYDYFCGAIDNKKQSVLLAL